MKTPVDKLVLADLIVMLSGRESGTTITSISSHEYHFQKP